MCQVFHGDRRTVGLRYVYDLMGDLIASGSYKIMFFVSKFGEFSSSLVSVWTRFFVGLESSSTNGNIPLPFPDVPTEVPLSSDRIVFGIHNADCRKSSGTEIHTNNAAPGNVGFDVLFQREDHNPSIAVLRQPERCELVPGSNKRSEPIPGSVHSDRQRCATRRGRYSHYRIAPSRGGKRTRTWVVERGRVPNRPSSGSRIHSKHVADNVDSDLGRQPVFASDVVVFQGVKVVPSFFLIRHDVPIFKRRAKMGCGVEAASGKFVKDGDFTARQLGHIHRHGTNVGIFTHALNTKEARVYMNVAPRFPPRPEDPGYPTRGVFMKEAAEREYYEKLKKKYGDV